SPSSEPAVPPVPKLTPPAGPEAPQNGREQRAHQRLHRQWRSVETLEVRLLPSVFESELDREILLLADELACVTEILPIRRLADAKRPVRLLHQTTGDAHEACRRRLRDQRVGEGMGLQPRFPETPEIQPFAEGLDVVAFVQRQANGNGV